jgi:signal transduction histidine kinase
MCQGMCKLPPVSTPEARGSARHCLTESWQEYTGGCGCGLTEGRLARTAVSARGIAISEASADPMLPRTRALKETIGLRDIIENYVKTREVTLDKAGIKTSISGAGRTVRANRSRLIQVIDNLVRNSIYWLRRGEATGEVDRPKQINIRLTESGFTISDNGSGVDPRYEEVLFEMFVTAKPDRDGGQGLGLFIIKQLLLIDGCDVLLLNDRNEHGRRYNTKSH